MIRVKRHPENPILAPSKNSWEAEAVFNGCPVRENGKIHLLYRAQSSLQTLNGKNFELSTIGHAESDNGIRFSRRRQLIKPEEDWEKFGCEDPRVTKFNDQYFIFYTALANFPPTAEGIRVGLALTPDLKKIEEKHQVTHFNSKAMALFPEKINGKIAAVLTVHTDQPPAKIALALFDKESQIWEKEFWDRWLFFLDRHVIPLHREPNDHFEVGAPPIKTPKGWLLVYSYIKNFFSPPPTFGIEVVLLDLENPLKIIGRTEAPLLLPEEEYELYGKVPKVIFPSGALVKGENLNIYYGAVDTTCCLARVGLNDLVEEMLARKEVDVVLKKRAQIKLERYGGNPIIQPDPKHAWESKATFNPGVIYKDGKAHILYRAMSEDNTSVIGYASTRDGLHLDERLPDPIYVPRENFEKKAVPLANSGCEDVRINEIDDRFYIFYTAYDGKHPWRIALSSIDVSSFLRKTWDWQKPILISPPGIEDKDCCLLPEKFKGKYVIFHRFEPCIWVDLVDGLEFGENKWVKGKILMQERTDSWDSRKIGLGSVPIKTREGWLFIYHGVSRKDGKYRLGAALLDLENPTRVKARLDYPIFEPETDYENLGLRPGTVFTCGALAIMDRLFVYYGAGDRVVGVASTEVSSLIEEVKNYKP